MTKSELASSSDWIPPREDSNFDYSSMQDHRDNGAADLGHKLDAGVIPGQ